MSGHPKDLVQHAVGDNVSNFGQFRLQRSVNRLDEALAGLQKAECIDLASLDGLDLEIVKQLRVSKEAITKLSKQTEHLKHLVTKYAASVPSA